MENCARCGACCVYFAVYEDRAPELRTFFKMAGVKCQYLDFDGRASCKVYENRPEACREFLCSSGEWQDKKIQEGLRKTREDIAKFFESYLLSFLK